MHIAPENDGKVVTIVIAPPDGKGDGGELRPTELMERTSRVIEETPGLNRRSLRGRVGGKHDWADRALRLLIEEKYVLAPPGGRQSYSSIRPFRK